MIVFKQLGVKFMYNYINNGYFDNFIKLFIGDVPIMAEAVSIVMDSVKFTEVWGTKKSETAIITV